MSVPATRGRWSPDRGRTWHCAQQPDLSERIPWTERRDQATVSDHIGRARFDHVEAVGRITLAEYRLAGGHVDWFQAAGELFDGGSGSGLSMGAVEQLDLFVQDSDVAV